MRERLIGERRAVRSTSAVRREHRQLATLRGIVLAKLWVIGQTNEAEHLPVSKPGCRLSRRQPAGGRRQAAVGSLT